jgi:hypothetical protein
MDGQSEDPHSTASIYPSLSEMYDIEDVRQPPKHANQQLKSSNIKTKEAYKDALSNLIEVDPSYFLCCGLHVNVSLFFF